LRDRPCGDRPSRRAVRDHRDRHGARENLLYRRPRARRYARRRSHVPPPLDPPAPESNEGELFVHDSRSLRFVLERPLRVALGALLLLAACGGGGGGNGGGGGGGPTPPPGTSPTPRPSLAPTPVPTPNPERVKLLLAEGETVAGLTVSDIEDAGFNNSGAIGAIVTVRNANGGRAVLLGGADGDFTPVVTPDSPP